ncbi:FAD-linked oxidoreductase pyvE [Fulvia fulva]|uniref:FAD-linked oxidoreductase pyvE n=1 Tax=Passalora fulva TaxID=5499 RepID=A0A9Q8PHL3_PASFU|nr:FAD-linked oxidoreductase pyvE [Fulvia fulva]KAK4628255.1 hypothetical protein CLAFUR0_05093 [Fulvia fulva]UJO22547.1 FAD-linked oxidoreductase pyvE [Fulvia fulva]WPV28171.1 hypothetical protein CLAFUW7_05097 [Fulvia fulva]
MTITDQETSELRALCPGATYTRSDDEFSTKSAPWSVWADRHPQLVVEPRDLPTMQQVVKYLHTHKDIDFCIGNTGTGGASASDVCPSMHGFKDFLWEPSTATVTLGAGWSWGEVDKLMEEKTDSYACLFPRGTWVGVTGGALVGGLSWLSHEHGMISDPQNLLDAQVVLRAGRTVWAAKQEPDLMWALRVGGGNFGVVTAPKMHAKKVPKDIFAGIISIPYSSLAETSKAVAAMHARPSDPKVAMHITNQGPGMGTPDQGAKPNIAIMPIDFHGEAHARSEEGFAWAWNLPGAVETVGTSCSFKDVNALADSFKNYQGKNMFWLSAPLISSLDPQTLIRAFKWYEDSYHLHHAFGTGSTVLLEFMQEPAFNSTPSKTSTAWPRGRGRRHVMQLVLGCDPNEHPKNGMGIRELVMKRFEEAGLEIGGREAWMGEWHAGFLHEWNDLEEVFGENWGRLREVKKFHDPGNRFDKGVDLADGWVTRGSNMA